jgi:hypothetical protein
MKSETTILSFARAVERPNGPGLFAALDRASLRADRCRSGLYRLRAPTGRTVYVEERPHGASGRSTWVVHADAFGADAPRQITCGTIARVLIAIRAALEGEPGTQAGATSRYLTAL